jgi:type IV secretion system protein TrbB
MGAYFLRSEAVSRGARMLRTALGSAIAAWLEDPTVIEVMLNPDGHIWIDRLTDGLADTGEWLAPADGERIIRLVAHHVGAEVHPSSPRVSAELPETGERFEGSAGSVCLNRFSGLLSGMPAGFRPPRCAAAG